MDGLFPNKLFILLQYVKGDNNPLYVLRFLSKSKVAKSSEKREKVQNYNKEGKAKQKENRITNYQKKRKDDERNKVVKI